MSHWAQQMRIYKKKDKFAIDDTQSVITQNTGNDVDMNSGMGNESFEDDKNSSPKRQNR